MKNQKNLDLDNCLVARNIVILFPDATGVLMLHIPVEGGRKGGSLTVKHEQGDTIIPFQLMAKMSSNLSPS